MKHIIHRKPLGILLYGVFALAASYSGNSYAAVSRGDNNWHEDSRFAGVVQSQTMAASLWFIAPGGSDSNTGSISDPFATLEKASSVANPGDTIYFRAGTYGGIRHNFRNSSGAPGQPIVVRPYQGESVVLDGTSVSISSSQSLLSIASYDPEPLHDISIEGLEVQNSSGRGITYYNVTQLQIKDCTVHHIAYKGIGGWGHYVTISANTVHHAAMINENGVIVGGGWPGIIQPSENYVDGAPATYHTISGNTVHDCWGEGILIGNSHHVTVESNIVYDVFSVLIYLDKVSDVVVRNNYLYCVNPAYNRPDKGYPANAISMANEAPISAGEIPIARIHIYNNIMAGCGRGISYWQDSANSDPENSYSAVSVFHNTIHDPVHQAIWFDEVPAGYTAPADCHMHNNIIGRGSLQSEVDNPSAWSFSHNNWVVSIPAFAADANSFTGDPLFTSPVPGGPAAGFQLQSASPCVNAGSLCTPAVDADYSGLARDDDPDIGAFEYPLPALKVQMRLLLQGAYDASGDSLRTDLTAGAWLPHESPYAQDAVTLNRFPDDSLQIVDWILLQLVENDGVTVTASQSAFVNKDGWTKSRSGRDVLSFPGVAAGTYYLKVHHRNHVTVMSHAVQALVSGITAVYDFTSGSNQYYGIASAIELVSGVWGTADGDMNQDGFVTTSDYVLWFNAQRAGASGYQIPDLTLDGRVDAADFQVWQSNARQGFESGLP